MPSFDKLDLWMTPLTGALFYESVVWNLRLCLKAWKHVWCAERGDRSATLQGRFIILPFLDARCFWWQLSSRRRTVIRAAASLANELNCVILGYGWEVNIRRGS